MIAPPLWDRLLQLTLQGDLSAAASLKSEAARRGDLPTQVLACAALKDFDCLVSLALNTKAKAGDEAICAWARTLGVCLSTAHIRHIEDLMDASNRNRTVRHITWTQVFKAIAGAKLARAEGGVSYALEHAGRFASAMRATRTSACLAVYLQGPQTLTLGIQFGPSGAPSPPTFWPSLRPWRKVMSRNTAALTQWAIEPPQIIHLESSLCVFDRLVVPCEPLFHDNPHTPDLSHPLLDKFRAFLKQAADPGRDYPLEAILEMLRAWPSKAQSFLAVAIQEALSLVSDWPPERRVLTAGVSAAASQQPWELWYQSLRLSTQPDLEALLAHPAVAKGHIQHISADLLWGDAVQNLSLLLARWPYPLNVLEITGKNYEIGQVLGFPAPPHPINVLRVRTHGGVLRRLSPSPLLSRVQDLALPDATFPALGALLSSPFAGALRALAVRCAPRATDEPSEALFGGAPLALERLQAVLSYAPRDWTLRGQSDRQVEVVFAQLRPFSDLVTAGQNPSTLRDLTLVLSSDFSNRTLEVRGLCDRLCDCAQKVKHLRSLQIINRTPNRAQTHKALSSLGLVSVGESQRAGFLGLLSGSLASLRALTLRRIGLNDDCATRLASTPSLAALESLDLSENCISAEGFSALAQSEVLSGLRSLCLRQNPVAFGKRGKLKRLDWRLRALTHLDLGESDITAYDLTALASLLTDGGLPSLQTLSLAGCKLGAAGAKVLVGAPVFSVLSRLDLAQCGFGPSTIKLIQSQPWTYGRVTGLSADA